MMEMGERVDLSHKAARALRNAPRELAFDIKRRLVEEYGRLVSEGVPFSAEVAEFIDRYGAEGVTPAWLPPDYEPPLTPDEQEQLLIEVVMDTPEDKTQVPDTAESRKLRAVLTKQVREMKAKGIMPMLPN